MLVAIIIGAGAYLGLIRYAWRAQRGRALNRHPYFDPYDDAPGARSQRIGR